MEWLKALLGMSLGFGLGFWIGRLHEEQARLETLRNGKGKQ